MALAGLERDSREVGELEGRRGSQEYKYVWEGRKALYRITLSKEILKRRETKGAHILQPTWKESTRKAKQEVTAQLQEPNTEIKEAEDRK